MQKVRPAGIRPAFSRRMNGLWTEEEGKGRFFLWAPDAVLLWVRKTGFETAGLADDASADSPLPRRHGDGLRRSPLSAFSYCGKNRTSGPGDPGDRFSAPPHRKRRPSPSAFLRKRQAVRPEPASSLGNGCGDEMKIPPSFCILPREPHPPFPYL